MVSKSDKFYEHQQLLLLGFQVEASCQLGFFTKFTFKIFVYFIYSVNLCCNSDLIYGNAK